MSTTFNLIVKKLANLDNNIFSYNYDKTDKVSGINKIFFNILINNQINNYKSKFYFLKDTVENFYFKDKNQERNVFLELFYKIQQIYHTLNRFTYLYKLKKAKLIVNTDMQLNTIDINDINVICIYHVDSKYLFKIEDLLKIIYISLTNCFSFIAEPITIKNPYNNISFGKSVLYYIYYYLISYSKIKYIKSDYLDIFFKFKESNFNMTKFVNSYEYILREYSIKNYLINTEKKIIKEQIMSMINCFNLSINSINKKIIIDSDFPEKDLIRIMKPYLYYKFQSHYSFISKNKYDAKIKLNKKLKEFQKFNPNFGRKIIKFKNIYINGKIKRVKSHIEFNMTHKKFNNFEIENFMNNHLTYKYDGGNDIDDSDEYSSEQNENLYSTFTYFIINNQMLNSTENNNFNSIDEGVEDNEDDDEEHEDEDEEEYEEEYQEEDEEEYEEEYQEEDEDEETEDDYSYDEVDSVS